MSRLVCLSFVVALAAACHASSPSTTATTPPPAAAGDDRCPMDVAGTSVAVEDTATGGALVFASTGDQAALRTRIAGWAERHNQQHSAMGPLPTGDEPAAGGGEHAHHHHHDHGAMTASGGGGGDPATWIAAHSRAEASDTEQGARLTFVTFPDQVAALQAELRVHAEHLGRAGCGAR